MSPAIATSSPGRRVRGGEQMVLTILIGGVGNHTGAWRRPGSRVEEKYGLSLFRDLAGWSEATPRRTHTTARRAA